MIHKSIRMAPYEQGGMILAVSFSRNCYAPNSPPNKNVDITQQGSASHMARVTLTGLPVDLSLTQTGSTQQYYSINFNCATAGGCSAIQVQQGN